MNYNFLNTTILHGVDYNPDQWLDQPEILNEDIRMMKLAHINCVSLAIFAWSRLEPEEENYQFDWLAEIIDKLHENNIYTLLSTPSGARPVWMAQKYPEVLRVNNDMTRNMMGGRHNHCYTSPVYRKKVYDMNYRLAERFGNHPAVLMWHISNEYGGECFCPMCQEEFRNWLQKKYKTLDKLNQAWWNTFWSHTYTDWSQIDVPVPKGELCVHGLNLDWKRFVTDRTVDFCRWEISAVRAAGSMLPTTANFMGFYDVLNYFKFKDVIDIISWDNYPEWHMDKDDMEVAIETAATHDLMRSIKKKPFLLMESTPSTVNWRSVAKLKRPDMHMLSSMQAIAHGSNSVQYFQWRKSRGSFEKFHGAVVDHYGKEDTRVFNDVAAVGKRMEYLGELCNANVKPEVAIIYDWESGWAYGDAAGPHKPNNLYKRTILNHYSAFWNMGIPVDFVDMEEDIKRYKLVIAPLLYLYRAGIEEKFKNFVKNGGTLIGTYWSGIVNETDLCYTGGMPGGGMMEIFGLRSEEVDALYEKDYNEMKWNGKSYQLHNLCDLVVVNTAEILACYQQDFYEGKAALLKNKYGTGSAYYLAADAEIVFYDDFYSQLSAGLNIKQSIKADLPYGVTANIRKGKREIVIIQNFNPSAVEISIDEQAMDIETEEQVKDTLKLARYETRLLVKY